MANITNVRDPCPCFCLTFKKNIFLTVEVFNDGIIIARIGNIKYYFVSPCWSWIIFSSFTNFTVNDYLIIWFRIRNVPADSIHHDLVDGDPLLRVHEAHREDNVHVGAQDSSVPLLHVLLKFPWLFEGNRNITQETP